MDFDLVTSVDDVMVRDDMTVSGDGKPTSRRSRDNLIGERISKEMVIKQFIGLTWIGTTSGGSQYIAKLNKDGTLEVEIPNLGAAPVGRGK